jgi:hypothetical protein
LKSQILRKRKSENKLLDLSCIGELSEKINVHLEDLFSNNFKLNASFVNDIYKMNLDSRYTIATNSKTRPIANILSYLEQKVHHRAKLNVFRKFQITEDFILNEENSTNILLITDILNYLKREYQLTEDHFISIGQMTHRLSFNKVLDDQLSKFHTLKDTFVFFIEECSTKFDTNCEYKILENNKDKIQIRSTPRKEVLEELSIKPENFGNQIVSYSKMGVISSVSHYNFKMNLPAKLIKSVNEGGNYDLYEFNPRILDKLSGSFREPAFNSAYH